MSWLKRLLGSKDDTDTQPNNAPNIIAEDDPRVTEGQDLVQAHWESVGKVDDDVVTYLVNPMFQGAPAWPNTRQAYRVIRTPGSLIIASDGLSDPFVGTDRDGESGFGMEVFIEIDGAQDRSFDEISSSPEFKLIECVAQNMAGHGGVAPLIDQMGVLSMAVPVSEMPGDGWLDQNGQVGVLIGLAAEGRSARLDLPFGPVRILAVTPLRPAETAIVVTGTEARNDIADRLMDSPSRHRFDPVRPAV